MKLDLKHIFGKKANQKKDEDYDGLTQEKPAEIVDVEPPTGVSIKREYVYIGIALLIVIFAIGFIYGFSDTEKSINENREVKVSDKAMKGTHLENVPDKYSDQKPKKEDKKQDDDKNDIETSRQTRVNSEQTSQSYHYQRIPTAQPPAVIRDNPQQSQPRQQAIDPAVQIRAQQAKEKETANKSPIQFSVGSSVAKVE